MQNEDHAEFLNHLADQSGAIFDTAGSLRGGRRVFLTMRLAQGLRVGGVDEVDLNIAALNNHDGNGAFRLLLTPVRVVCANTRTAALAHYQASFSVRHTRRHAKPAVAAARDALGVTFAYSQEFEAEAERLLDTTLTDAAFHTLIASVFPSPGPDASPRLQAADPERRNTRAHLFHDADTRPASAVPRRLAAKPWPSTSTNAPVRANTDTATARAAAC